MAAEGRSQAQSRELVDSKKTSVMRSSESTGLTSSNETAPSQGSPSILPRFLQNLVFGNTAGASMSSHATQHTQEQLLDELYEAVGQRDVLEQDRNELQKRICELQEENAELDRANLEISDKYISLEGQARSMVEERDGLRHDYHQSQKAQQAMSADNRRLQEQVSIYKKNLSSSTRTQSQISDDDIQAKWNNIFYAIQDFCVKHCRGRKYDFAHLPEGDKDSAHHLAGGTVGLASQPIISVMIGFISKSLLRRFGPRFYFGYGEESVFRTAHNLSNTLGEVGVQGIDSWLETTRQLIGRADEPALQRSDLALVEKMMSDLRGCFPAILSEGNDSEAAGSSKKIYATVQDFFRLLLRQKAQFLLEMPRLAALVKFDPQQMEIVDVGDEDDELEGRQVGLSVFPGIYKFGDENGQNLDVMTVVSRAKVLLKKPRKLEHRKPQQAAASNMRSPEHTSRIASRPKETQVTKDV